MNTKYTDRIVGNLISMIESENLLPWQSNWISEGLPYNYTTGKYYSGRNILLLMMQKHNRKAYMTYNQAKLRGFQVRKGECGIPIVWAQNGGFCNVEVEKEDGTKETVSKYSNGGARLYWVFNISQIDGVPDMPRDTVVGTTEIDELMSKLGVKIVHGKNPIYHGGEDYIGMPYVSDFEKPDYYYGALFHEMIHWTGAGARLNRFGNQGNVIINQHNLQDRSFEELVAELGSAILRGRFHIDYPELDETNAAYVKSWVRVFKNDKTMILKAATEAQKAVDYILSAAGYDKDTGRPVDTENAAEA